MIFLTVYAVQKVFKLNIVKMCERPPRQEPLKVMSSLMYPVVVMFRVVFGWHNPETHAPRRIKQGTVLKNG